MSGKRAREVRAENAVLVEWVQSQFEGADNRLQALRFARAFRKAKHTLNVQHRVKGAGTILVRRFPLAPESPDAP